VIYGCSACTASDQFKCPNVDRCIHAALVCDGENQCGDGSDELNCGKPHFHYFNQSINIRLTKCRPAFLSINNCSCNCRGAYAALSTGRPRGHQNRIISLEDLNRNVFSWRQKVVVDRGRFSRVGSVFRARGAATEKAVSSIRRRVGVTTTSPV